MGWRRWKVPWGEPRLALPPPLLPGGSLPAPKLPLAGTIQSFLEPWRAFFPFRCAFAFGSPPSSPLIHGSVICLPGQLNNCNGTGPSPSHGQKEAPGSLWRSPWPLSEGKP